MSTVARGVMRAGIMHPRASASPCQHIGRSACKEAGSYQYHRAKFHGFPPLDVEDARSYGRASVVLFQHRGIGKIPRIESEVSELFRGASFRTRHEQHDERNLKGMASAEASVPCPPLTGV